MIGFLRGTPNQMSPNRVLVDVGGVGYAVQIPLSTYYELQKQPEEGEVTLFIHTHVRETEISLYGFWSEREQRLFERLITISGIGPRLAQTVLSGMSPDDFVDAVSAGDLRRLSGIPGVGKKTAERMVVELRDKIRDLAGPKDTGSPATAPPPSADDDLVMALVHLGYKAAAAERAVAAVRAEVAGEDFAFADLLRLSLKRLSRV